MANKDPYFNVLFMYLLYQTFPTTMDFLLLLKGCKKVVSGGVANTYIPEANPNTLTKSIFTWGKNYQKMTTQAPPPQ